DGVIPLALHEMHADLAVLAANNPAAPAENERELVRHGGMHADRQLCAGRGNVADDAGERLLADGRLDMRKILHFVAWAQAKLTETTALPEQTHVRARRNTDAPNI